MADLSKTSRSRRAIAIVAVSVAAVLASCGGGSNDKAGDTSPTTLASSGATTTVGDAPGSGTGTPSHKPCDLLTKEIAETTLGVAVREPKDAPGQGNETCSYRAAGTSIAQVYVTTYAATGTEAALDAAAAQFKNVRAVAGLGDAARVSLDDHAIGVLKGDFIFAIGMILPGDGQGGLAPVTEKQMVDVATAVLARA